MKKTRSLMLLIASLFALTVSAQGIIVHQGNSKKIEFKSKDVQKIEFTENQVENTIDNYVEKSALDEKQSELDKALGKISELSDLIKELQAQIDAGGGSGETGNMENGHEFVDLGLSVKWATMNVGATEVAGTKINSHTGQLDCYGEYFSWGETSPKDSYNWSTYTLCNGSSSSMTKYCTSSSYGTVDNKTTLELSDDAARANWGGSWRMPTYAEQTELRSNCYWEWTTSYNNSGVKGYIVYKAKNTSDKGKCPYYDNGYITPTPTASYSLSDTHIFLPASGYRGGSSFGSVGSGGYYWSSSLDADGSRSAYFLNFDSGNVVWSYGSRDGGPSVRAVCP